MPEMSNVFNLIVGGILLLGALVGFIRGSKKALFYFIFFGAFFLVAFLAFPFLINIALTKEVQGFSARASLIDLLSANNPDLLVLVEGDTLVYSFLETLVTFLAKHVWIVIILVLAFFVLPIITGIFWFAFRKKHKKSFLTRMIGALIGAVHSAVYVFIISIILSGFISIGDPAYHLIQNEQGSDGLIQLSTETEEDIISEALTGYHNSYLGKSLKLFKIKEKPLDLFLYDQTFNLKFKKQTIYLREEVVNLVLLAEDVLEDIDTEEEDILATISALDDDVLTTYVDRLTDLKMINVLFPLGVEFIINTDIIDTSAINLSSDEYQQLLNINFQQEIKALGHIGIDALDLIKDLNMSEINFLGFDPDKVENILTNLGELELMNIAAPLGLGLLLEQEDISSLIGDQNISFDNLDFKAEFSNFGALYKNLYDLNINTNYLSDIDFLALDVLGVKKVLNSIGSLEIVNIVGPIALNFALEQEEIKEIFADLDGDLSDISFKNEFIALGNIYESFRELGIKELDLEKIQFDLIEDEKIENFSEALYSLQLVQKSTPSVVNYLVNNMMPAEFSDYISPDSITSINWNAKEVSSILLLGKLLISNGALDEEFDFTKLLTESTTAALAKYMANSQLITGNLTPLITGLIDQQNIEFLSDLTIEEDFIWTEDELFQIFQVARLSLDLLVDGNLDFANVDDQTIEELATAMFSSTIIANNMTPIFTSLVAQSDVGLTIEVDEDFDWSKREINSILKSVKIIYTKGGDITNLFGVEDSEIDVFLGSKLITTAMINYFYEYTQEGSELDGILVVKLSQDDQNWHDQYEGDVRTKDGELRKLIKALGLLLGDNYDLGQDIDINLVTSLQDEDITVLLDSQIVNDSVRHMLINFAGEDGELKDLLIINLSEDDPRWNDSDDEPGEIRKLIRAFKLVFGENLDMNNPDLNINTILDLTEEEMTTLLDSQIMSDSIINQIYLLAADGGQLHGTLIIPTRLANYNEDWYGTDGELQSFIKGMQVVIPADGDVNSFEINMILNLDDPKIDTMLSSAVISDSFINQIYTLSDVDGQLYNTLIIPTDLVKYDPKWYGETGELKSFIKGMQVIIPTDGNVNELDVSLDVLYDDDNLTTIASSLVILETIYHHIETSDPANDGTIVVDRLRSEGEFINFVNGMKILLPSGQIEEVELNLTKFYDDDNIDVLLDSYVINDTIIKHLEETDNDSLDTTRLRDEGELRRFFKAVEIVLPDGEIDNLSLNLQEFYDDDKLDTLLASHVMEDTITNHIKESQIAKDGILVVDSLDNPGELRRFFKAVSIILPSGDIETVNFDVESMYDKTDQEIDILFASEVISDSVIKEIEDNNTGALNTNRITTAGELPRLIKAFKVIIPSGDIANVDLSVDVIKLLDNSQLDTLVSSRVIEDSIIDVVSPMFESGEMLHLYFKNPTEIDSQWERVYNIEGEVVTEGELIPFIEAIRMMEDAGMPRDQINIESIAGSEADLLAEAILHSNLIAKSISKMFNQVLKDANLDDHPLSPYPIDDKEYDKQELIELIETIKFIYAYM